MTKTQFITTYDSLPEELKKEVEQYVELLAKKAGANTSNPKEALPNKTRGGYSSMKGMFKMPDDFDAPLDDLKEYM